MKQRGRKSAAALTAVSDLTGRRRAPVPPPTLTVAELACWRRVVDRAPIGLLQPEQSDLIATYVAHTVEAERLRAESRVETLSLGEFARILGLAQRESALALAHGRALRLTVQSRMGASTAGRKTRDISALWARDVEPAPSDDEPQASD